MLRAAEEGRCGLSLEAWFLAHFEKRPSPEGSLGLVIIEEFYYYEPFIPRVEGRKIKKVYRFLINYLCLKKVINSQISNNY